ncbi:MAG TPA: HD domain-containing protein [Ktedonobacteraceae bacterium]|nr:HD domain-containing protein [Ktedonobacteraceae bacterium]
MQVNEFESQVMSKVYEDIRQRYVGFGDLAHGWEHIQRVYKLGSFLAEQEQADAFIVGMSALMHDMGHLSDEQTNHHAKLSLMMAQELLAAYQVSSDMQQSILHAIEAHSFSLGVEPRTLEAKIVRDADRLDALGAIGILRWAITGAVRNKGETQTYHPDDPFGEWHTLDDRRYMLDHFFTKLLKLEDTMTTHAGRVIARQRTAFMHAYLDEFRNELET